MPAEPVAVPDPRTERDLVDGARTGDSAALGAIYDRYITLIYRYVMSRMGNPTEAEDITQEVFLRVAENIHRFEWRPDVPFSAWLYRIAQNQIITHHRRAASRPSGVSADDLDVEDSRPGPESIVEYTFTVQELADACRKLPAAQRDVISLRFGSDLSVRETAEILGKTENNVKVLQHKAIQKLQKLFGV